MRYGESDEDLIKLKQQYGRAHSTQWVNMRPICPYGCGEEGQLLEVIVKDGKALGIYSHSQSVKPFTADLQMAPKPTTRRIKIGPDGEPMVVQEDEVS